MMSQSQRKLVWALIAAFFIANVAVSEVVAPGHLEYLRAAQVFNPDDFRNQEVRGLASTPFQSLMATMLGVREVLAALMWVRADDYFHRGEYRPIITMVKQITTIDPHQIDVFATGAWHMAYNFMDKRLIEDGVKFLEDGCKKNDSVYDLFFELGYMHYDKTKNYREAVRVYQESAERGTTTGKTIPPSFVRHQLAHAMEKMGDIDMCLKQWEENLRVARDLEKRGEYALGPSGPNAEAARHNLYITGRRRNERLAALAERDRNREEAMRLWGANVQLAEDWLKQSAHSEIQKDLQVAHNQVDRLRAGRLLPIEPQKIDVRFRVTRTQPRELLIEGVLPVLNLSRVYIRFADKDYERLKERGFDYKMDNLSLEYDNISVQKGKFRWNLRLNRDPADMGRRAEEIYPLKSQEYELTVRYHPRRQAAFIQDRYGWNGEGITADPDQLEVDEKDAGILNGKRYPMRTAAKTISLKREDVLAAGKKVLYDRM